MLNEDVFDRFIARWRAYVEQHGSPHESGVEELENRLRAGAAALLQRGLSPDEAIQVAARRIGRTDPATRDFVLEHAAWLMAPDTVEADADETALPESGTGESGTGIAGIGEANSDQTGADNRKPAFKQAEILLVLCLAVGAAMAIKIPTLFGYVFDEDDVEMFYFRNVSFFVFPFLTAYFVWKRRMDFARWGWLAVPFIAAAFLCNIFPFKPGGDTAVLTVLHTPVALWLVLGYAYTGGNWRVHDRRMDFVRFSGQLFILFVLFALGGGVFIGITLALFSALGLNLEGVAVLWIMPCGAMGAIVVASWLVETRRGATEHVAPVLTRVFTPLFTVMLLSFLAALAWTGKGIHVQREMLIAFDLLLIVVLGLVLYAVTARNAQAPPGVFDGLQIVLVIAALVVDLIVVTAMTARITEFGFTPNRLCALGLNIILFVNLAWTAWMYIRFIRGRGSFSAVARWQTTYLPVYAAWAGFVVAVFPTLFGYM